MGAIVEAAFCGAVRSFIGLFVLLPMGLLFLGYLVFIAAGIFRESRKK